MENNKINATCAICGKGYHVCQDSLDQKTFRPWRTVTDTAGHYRIYLAIHSYTLTKDKAAAKDMLEKCDLSGVETFPPDIQKIINEIRSENTHKDKVKLKYNVKNDRPDSLPEKNNE